MDTLIAFVAAGMALAGSPGPNTLSLAATGAAFGARRSLRYMLGTNVGMVAVMAITASGITGLLLAIPGAAPVLVAVAAVYFLYLAWRIATAPALIEAQKQTSPPSPWAGFLLSLVNPKGYAAMAALFSGFTLVPHEAIFDALFKIIVLSAVIATVNVAWLALGSLLTSAFRNPRLNRLINILFAALLLSSLLALLL